MKKILSVLVLIAIVFSLTSCDISFITQFLGEDKDSGGIAPGPSDENEEKEEPDDSQGSQEPETPACDHNYVEIDRTEAKPLSDGVIIYECSHCKGKTTEVHTPMTRKLKLLAIGNSFSNDALGYLWDICNAAGVEELIIGHAYIGGCSLDMHGSNMLYSNPAYEYHKYEGSSNYTKKEGVKIDYILEDEEWDCISLQQLSELTGTSYFSLLDKIVEKLNKKCPDAELYWHMTWSFRYDSEYKGFALHNYDQMALYNALMGVVNDIILPRGDFKGIIPAGTAMQNLRTSYIGDNVTRDDGYHADLGIGRYTIGLTWYATFTGGSLDLVEWVPGNSYRTSIINSLDAIHESVQNALANPYEITQSKLTVAP